MKKTKIFILLSMIILIIFMTACTETKSIENLEDKVVEFPDNEYLVNSEWLKKNNDSNELIILDARGEKAYLSGHIPNAMAISWQKLSNMEGAPGDEGWGVLKNKDSLEKILSSYGIDKNKKIVVYADTLNGWGEDGRIFWSLKIAGIENVRILDGGINQWKEKNNELSKKKVVNKKYNLKLSKLDKRRTIEIEELKNNLDKYLIIDTREKKEYDGSTDYGEKRGGHLPNAKHFNFRNVLNEKGLFKSEDELKRIFKSEGYDANETIVTYCTAGIRSAHLQIALEMAGYSKAKNYDASFHEWAGNDECIVEK